MAISFPTQDDATYYKVSYIHLQGYRVSRTFDTEALAQRFIDDNALVFPLPGVRLERMA